LGTWGKDIAALKGLFLSTSKWCVSNYDAWHSVIHHVDPTTLTRHVFWCPGHVTSCLNRRVRGRVCFSANGWPFLDQVPLQAETSVFAHLSNTGPSRIFASTMIYFYFRYS
jgi:hypothetical protein